jgi:type IV secretory pathway VirB10-like protein
MFTVWCEAGLMEGCMDAFDPQLRRRPRGVGLRLGVIVLVLVVVVGAWVGAYWWALSQGHLKTVERAVAPYDSLWPWWMGKGAKKATYVEPGQNGSPLAAVDPRDEQLRKLQRELDEQRRVLELMRQQKPAPPAAAPKPTTVKAIKRAPLLAISHERKDEGILNETDLILTPGTWIPAVLETTLNSEIEGYFTLKTRKPVFDSVTGQQVVIPQGHAIVARDTSSALLFGNERIPTFAVSLSLPGGRSVELGDAPIMDATGTNGLTGEVNNHIWRLVWTSIFIGGLRGGQQMLQAELAQESGAMVVTGIAQQGSIVAQQRLGRAQDTRPTITVQPGELVNVLITKPFRMPLSAVAQR